MNATFATVIHAAPKLDVDELLKVRQQIGALLEPEFVKECDTNYDLLNPVVAKNIDFKTPEEGEVIMRLCQLAKERNIDYKPTHEACQALHAYCLRKGIPAPEGVGGPDGPVPTYAPQPQMQDFAALDQPSPPQNPPGGGMPPGAGMPPGGGGGYGGAPAYLPPAGGQPPIYQQPGPMGAPAAYPAPMQPQGLPPQLPDMSGQPVAGVPVMPPPEEQKDPNDKPNGADATDDFQARIDALKNL